MDASRCSKCGAFSPVKEAFNLVVAPGTLHYVLLNSNNVPEGFELTFIRSVISEADARLASLDDEISRFQQTIKRLEEERVLVKSYRQKNIAILSPLRRMPPEVLGEIFQLTLPPGSDQVDVGKFDITRSPWVLTRVSSRWRAIAVSTPSLWSRLAIDYSGTSDPSSAYPLSLARTHLQRAHKLKIYFKGYRSGLDVPGQIQMFQLLSEYSSRWEELILILTADIVPLFKALQGRLSSLKRLWIRWCMESQPAVVRLIDCFQPASSLVDVGLCDCDYLLAPTFLPIHQLTRLHLDGSWTKVMGILKLASNLIEARLKERSWQQTTTSLGSKSSKNFFEGASWPVVVLSFTLYTTLQQQPNGSSHYGLEGKNPTQNESDCRETLSATTTAELYKMSTIDWFSERARGAEGARQYLIQKAFVSEDCDPVPTLDTLALVLLRAAATPGLSAIAADAVRAVACILEGHRAAPILADIASNVKALLERPSAPLPAYGAAEDEGGRGADDIWELTSRLEDRVKAVEERVVSTPIGTLGDGGVPPAPTTHSYAGIATGGAAQSRPHPKHAIALANAHAKDCQIMVDRSPMVNIYSLANLSEKELVQKANLALGIAVADLGDNTAPDKMAFVGARKVRSGAVVLHLNTPAAAEWIRAPKRIAAFLTGMGGTSIYRPRNFSCVVEFVPVSFDPGLSRAFEAVEDANGLDRGAISQAHYIKPLERRHPGQRSAHAIFGFASAAAANHAIRHRLFVDGKRVPVRKLLSEPIRCLKCQIVGANHTAGTCPSVHDTCARCGEMHRTNMCKVRDEERACSNCRAARRSFHGHGAADRSCPVFVDKVQFALERNPDAKYRFFPTDDPESWEQMGDVVHTNQEATWQNGNAWSGGVAHSDGRSRGTPKPGLSKQGAARSRAAMGAVDAGWSGMARMRQPTLGEVLEGPGAGAKATQTGVQNEGEEVRSGAQEGENQRAVLPPALSRAASVGAVHDAPTNLETEDVEEAGLEELARREKMAKRREAREAQMAAVAAAPPFRFSDDGEPVPAETNATPAALPPLDDVVLPESIVSPTPGVSVGEQQ
ncbi:RNA-directed DNA polymerase from transposon X-element [Mycena venus]|uniref:RNA-directed DNA polymerase from transposon X-element n=1 Tax=Mycena venus TaxID=2733690 RepID=A0A8H6YJV9_9AGAR|nr:RNA-directed DNA polymerase from transposon X-element [Mycena venus]